VWVFIPLVEQEFSSDEVEEIAHLAEAAGFTVLDLSDVFEGHTAESLWRAEYDQHPNAKGHEVIADRLYKEMIENESFFSNTLSP
jgi:lysophospholipase L1-like esterase